MLQRTIIVLLSALLVFLIRPSVTHAVNYNLTGQWNWSHLVDNTAAQYHGVAEMVHQGDTLTFSWRWPEYDGFSWTGTGNTTTGTLTIDAAHANGHHTATFSGSITENGNRLAGRWQQYYDGDPAGSGDFWATRIGSAPPPFPDSSPPPSPSPSPTPTPSPSPTPSPQPFLDLPWEYESKGLSFNDAALAINSFFDHEYPLLSSALSEPTSSSDSIVNYVGFPRTSKPYSSHDGYDWGKGAKANIGDPVLAAGAGCASYTFSGAGGNIIKIDHGNGYQTRYLHLQSDGLITASSTCTNVSKGQQIGKIGATGNVIPPGPLGAHIHFMVIEDKNHDGNFEDNIPDGVVDPFGWQSIDQDPWPSFAFSYAGQAKTGNTSYYLWTKPIANLSQDLTANGGFFQLEKFSLDFPQDAVDQNLDLNMKYSPNVKLNTLWSIGPSLFVEAINGAGEIIKDLKKPYGIEIDFSTFDLSPFNVGTISVYSSEDGVTWTKEDTNVDLENKKATTQVDHMSYFALMAEPADIVAPTTTANLLGTLGQPNWYRSNVTLNLNAVDNTRGLGVDYTLYRLDDSDWQQYTGSLQVTSEGIHTVEFYSVDKADNAESVKSASFNIDKTAPEAKIQFNQTTNKTEIIGTDENGGVTLVVQDTNYANQKITLTDKAGNTLVITGTRYYAGGIFYLVVNSLTYNNNNPINQKYNVFFTYNTQNSAGKLISLSQTGYQGNTYISITYIARTNQSIIYQKIGQNLQQQAKAGLFILQLQTNKGNLEYSY